MSFETLLNHVISELMLRLHDPEWLTRVETDSEDFLLYQLYPKSTRMDGTQLLLYLDTTTCTDHSSLSNLENRKNLSGRKSHWNAILCELHVKCSLPTWRTKYPRLMHYRPRITRCQCLENLRAPHKFRDIYPRREYSGTPKQVKQYRHSCHHVAPYRTKKHRVLFQGTPHWFDNSCTNSTMPLLVPTMELGHFIHSWGWNCSEARWKRTSKVTFVPVISYRRTSSGYDSILVVVGYQKTWVTSSLPRPQFKEVESKAFVQRIFPLHWFCVNICWTLVRPTFHSLLSPILKHKDKVTA